MYIQIPQVRENEERYLSWYNGLITVLKIDPYTDNTVFGSPIPNKNGWYYFNVTQAGRYKLYTGTTLDNIQEDTTWSISGEYLSLSSLNEVWTVNGNTLYPTSTDYNLALGSNDPQGNRLKVNGDILVNGNQVINGSLTTHSIAFVTETITELSATGGFDVVPSISITGISNTNRRNLFQALKYNDTNIPVLAVATGGNIGVNTNNPQSALSILGQTSLSGVLTIDNANGNITFTNSSGDLIITPLGSGRSVHVRPAGLDRFEFTSTTLRPRVSNLSLGENNLLWGDIFSSGTGFINSISATNTVSANNVRVNNQLILFNSALSQTTISANTVGRLINKSSSGIYEFCSANDSANWRLNPTNSSVISILINGSNNGLNISSNNAIYPNADADGDISLFNQRYRNIYMSSSGYFGSSISTSGLLRMVNGVNQSQISLDSSGRPIFNASNNNAIWFQLAGTTRFVISESSGSYNVNGGTDGVVNLGSPAVRFNNLSLSGTASIGRGLSASTIYTSSSAVINGDLQTNGSLITGGNIILGGDTLRFGARRTITSSSEHGIEGEWCWDNDYTYYCVENDVWKRTPHAENSW